MYLLYTFLPVNAFKLSQSQNEAVEVVKEVIKSNPIDEVLKRPEFIRKQRIEAEVIYLEEEKTKKENEIADIESRLSNLRAELVDKVE